MALDTKFRPLTFKEVIGQDVSVSILRAIIFQKKYGSAYLFSGPSGVGKTTVGRIFSKAILCESPVDGDPCCTCSSCQLFHEDKHFGYRELDAASFGGKDDMIKLRDDAAFLSIEKKKIILLDECHDISKQGQDALLKQVEQCPSHLIYIFCTTEPEKVNKTLRKRCVHFQFSKVDSTPILERLKVVCQQEGLVWEESALEFIADKSLGHVRDSLKLLEEVSFLGPITIDSVRKVSCDYSDLVFSVLANLGRDLPSSIESCKKASAILSNWDFYEQMLSMVSDAVKLFYGYDGFLPQRKEMLIKLRDIHGSTLLEFLNYLITRDKYVDRIGLYSDIVLLHYKFCSNGFQPQVPVQPVSKVQSIEPQQDSIAVSTAQASSPQITHAQLSKMSIKDRAAVLRSQRKPHNIGEKEEPQKVPVEWSLPKEERRPGAVSFEEKELTPLEFSKLLVGGRSGGI
jgi:DNA polymerase III subunit gamma/tau